jgi:hypothetical protein
MSHANTQHANNKAEPHPAPHPAPVPAAPIVYTDRHPEYPFLVYNHETRQTKSALDQKHKEELAKQGFVDDPFSPEDPDLLTEAEATQLQALLAKAAKALAKLGKLSGRRELENKPADKK